MAKKRVLVVEDDEAIRNGIVDALAFEGYEVFEASTRAAGTRMGLEMAFDIVLLDLVLPDGSGHDVLCDVRSARPAVPVVVLTALGQEEDKVRGLKLGADDYVVKPFSLNELLARLEAVLRRSAERPRDVRILVLASCSVDLERSEIRYPDGTRAEISERERDLVRYLAQNAGRVVSREELLGRVWKLPASLVRTRTIDVHVARLREKLRDQDSAIITTHRGRGYSFSSGLEE
ncbi:MAG: response regulator transcription factor [Deltaproteobacteria bacterium]|nr:response regulator transcription factor [Deltaproteobacteria bacterium]